MKANEIIKVKAWIIEKAQRTAGGYNTYIDRYDRDEDGTIHAGNEWAEVLITEIISESEKAIQVRLGSGNVVGSVEGWKLWIPKSQIAA